MKARLRAIIVDDERLARKDLRTLLAEYSTIEVVGEAENVPGAVALIGKEEPDLLFLDIQMPGESGFDLLARVDLRARVIFVTAFDEYAIRAFEVNAADYLLKPVNPNRLKTAIDRVICGEQRPAGKRHPLDYEDALLLRMNSHQKFVRVSSIVCIQAAGDYSEVFTSDGKKGLVQKAMAEWEERLPENRFCRIHRSTIINIDQIAAIEKQGGTSYHVCLMGIATPFTISRRYAALLREKRG